jgi:hypothetical protein
VSSERRSSDGDISEIRTQIKHLAESDEHLFREVAHIRKDTAEGFSALRELIQKHSEEANNRNRPQWQLYGLGLGLLGAFFAYEISQIVTPLKENLLLLDRKLDGVITRIDHHQRDGHPYTVISQVNTLKDTLDTRLRTRADLHEADIEHLEQWIKRVDEQGSIVHYGPKAEKHTH